MGDMLGMPCGMPAPFVETFFEWYRAQSQLDWMTPVKEAAKVLTFDELMRLIVSRPHPNVHVELFWVALYELSRRALSDTERDRVRTAYGNIKHILDAHLPAARCIGGLLQERRALKSLIG